MINQFTIRPIFPKDNEEIAFLIRAVFDEMNIPKKGTAYEDKALDNLYNAYQVSKAKYYIATNEQMVLGGAGIAPLLGAAENVCELQKMYVHPRARKIGVGQQLIQKCLEAAVTFKYTGCYLETLPEMKIAQHLYQKFGFNYLEAPMGNTGHSACHIAMFKNLC